MPFAHMQPARLTFQLLFGVTAAFFFLLQGAHADNSPAVEQWRAEAADIRRLADNDARQARQKAQRLKETLPSDATPADQACQLNILSRAEAYLGLSEQAGRHAEQALALAKQHADQLGQVQANLNIALSAVHLANINALFGAPTRALELLNGIEHPDLLAEAMLRQSMAFRRQGKIEESVAMATQTLEIAQRSQAPLAMTYAHQGMAISYDLSGRPTEALRHFSEMRTWAKRAQSTLLEGHALLGMSGQENKLGNFSKSEPLIQEAIKSFRTVGATFSIAQAKHALAEQLRVRNHPAEALPLLNEAIAIHAKFNNKIGLWWGLLARSSTYQSLHRLSEALADAQRIRGLANEIGLNQYLEQSIRQLALVHAALGHYRQAYENSTKAEEITARMARERASTHVIELTERYQSESRQRQIDELTRHNELQAARQRWLWTFFFTSLVLLTITVLFLHRQRRTNRLLATLNRQLEQSRNRLQATYDALPDLLFELGLDGHCYDCHSPRSEFLAAPVADLIGKMVADVLPPEITEICMAALHEANEQGISTGRQYALTLPHGTFWFEMSIARKTVPPGQPPRFIGLSRDISERKCSEMHEEVRLHIFERLALGDDLYDILTLVVRYIEEGRSELLCSIMLADNAGAFLHTTVAPHLPASYVAAIDTVRIREGFGACGTAAVRRETVIIEDIDTHPLWADYKHLALAAGLLACWSEPIIGATGSILGTFIVYLHQPGCPSDKDIELVRQASHLAAIAIERKRIETALAASEREFRTLAENMPDFISRYDTKCRKTYLNSALLKLIGKSTAALLGETPTESMPDHPEMAEYEAKLRRTLSTGQAESMDIVISQGPRAGETHNLRFVAEQAHDGRIVGALAISRDITQRKRIEDALAASEREFRTLAENTPDNVIRYDAEGRKTYMNASIRKTLGYNGSELGKMPSESYLHSPAVIAEYEAKLRRTLSNGQPERMDIIVDHGTHIGEACNVLFVAERDKAGHVVGALAIGRDISDLMNKERQIEKSRDLLRELAARRDTAREEERKHIAREIHDELGQMLTAQRLDIATLKFQFGADNPILADRCRHLIDIADQTIRVVRNVATALRPATLDMGITTAIGWLSSEFRARTGIICDLYIDEDEIEIGEDESIAVFRIVQESLTNVARYAEARQVEIDLETFVDGYHLSICDDGKGFNPDQLSGKSFGLIGIRERALLLGGEAHIISAPSRGTAIKVYIPRIPKRKTTP